MATNNNQRPQVNTSPFAPERFRPIAAPIKTYGATDAGAQLAQLSQALSGVAPTIGRLGEQLATRNAAKDDARALLEATREWEARQGKIAEEMPLVASGQIKKHESEIYKARYNEYLGMLAGTEYTRFLTGKLAASGMLETITDPEQFEREKTKWDAEFRKTHLGDNQGDLLFETAFVRNSHDKVEQLRGAVTAQAGENVAKYGGSAAQDAMFATVHGVFTKTVEPDPNDPEGKSREVPRAERVERAVAEVKRMLATDRAAGIMSEAELKMNTEKVLMRLGEYNEDYGLAREIAKQLTFTNEAGQEVVLGSETRFMDSVRKSESEVLTRLERDKAVEDFEKAKVVNGVINTAMGKMLEAMNNGQTVQIVDMKPYMDEIVAKTGDNTLASSLIKIQNSLVGEQFQSDAKVKEDLTTLILNHGGSISMIANHKALNGNDKIQLVGLFTTMENARLSNQAGGVTIEALEKDDDYKDAARGLELALRKQYEKDPKVELIVRRELGRFKVGWMTEAITDQESIRDPAKKIGKLTRIANRQLMDVAAEFPEESVALAASVYKVNTLPGDKLRQALYFSENGQYADFTAILQMNGVDMSSKEAIGQVLANSAKLYGIELPAALRTKYPAGVDEARKRAKQRREEATAPEREAERKAAELKQKNEQRRQENLGYFK